jgi:hypothetical protein
MHGGNMDICAKTEFDDIAFCAKAVTLAINPAESSKYRNTFMENQLGVKGDFI